MSDKKKTEQQGNEPFKWYKKFTKFAPILKASLGNVYYPNKPNPYSIKKTVLGKEEQRWGAKDYWFKNVHRGTEEKRTSYKHGGIIQHD